MVNMTGACLTCVALQRCDAALQAMQRCSDATQIDAAQGGGSGVATLLLVRVVRVGHL